MDDNDTDSVSTTTKEQYLDELKKWIDETRKHNQLSIALWQNFVQQVHVRENLSAPNVANNSNIQSHNQPIRFYGYKIPPIWKRLLAEIIDFVILFVIKMFLTLLILESIDFVDLDGNTISITELQKKLQNPQLAMQMSVEIVTLELLHRCIVCCYETYWLVVQRATPGKQYMGLAVVEASNFIPLQMEDVVLVHPATTLSVKDALLRSILKSVFIGFLLPICFVFLFFKFKRTGYDLLTKSLVVEFNPNPPVHEHR
ncbi:hypothetical protein RI129_011897 [Pyrocoelia pectoralis]|uniref:RDD domain-containing protein n=1 Tax=Pyrocoelia pectoralis TaxID=417401 RepID=A0AAN7UXR1_9COLE